MDETMEATEYNGRGEDDKLRVGLTEKRTIAAKAANMASIELARQQRIVAACEAAIQELEPRDAPQEQGINPEYVKPHTFEPDRNPM